MIKRLIAPAGLLALLTVGCPSDGPDPVQPPPPGTSDGTDPGGVDGKQDDPAFQRELDAWAAIQGQGTWVRLLPGKLKKDDEREKLEAALSDANGDAMRRLALLVRYSPVEQPPNGRVLNVGVSLGKHLEKNKQLGMMPPDDARTIALVLLPDAQLMATTRWLHYATGWTSVQEGVGTGAFHLQTAADMRTALAHAQNGRWDEAIPLYRSVFVRIAKLNTDRQGSASKPKWDAAEKLLEGGDLVSLEAALEAWWKTFVASKPKSD